jgi:hypothetical protein
MHRHDIAIGEPVKFNLSNSPVAFAATTGGCEFWAESDDRYTPVVRGFIVIGTGWEIPDSARYRLTAPRSPEGFVWHLYEMDIA